MQIEKSVDGVLGIRTRSRRMEGADETTELWRPPTESNLMVTIAFQQWPLAGLKYPLMTS